MQTFKVDLRTLIAYSSNDYPNTGTPSALEFIYYINVDSNVVASAGTLYYSPVSKQISVQKPSIADIAQALKDISQIAAEYFMKWVDEHDIVKMKSLGLFKTDLTDFYDHCRVFSGDVSRFASTLEYYMNYPSKGLTYEQYEYLSFAWPKKPTLDIFLPYIPS